MSVCDGRFGGWGKGEAGEGPGGGGGGTGGEGPVPAFSKRKRSSLPNSPPLFFLYQVFAVYWIFIATVGG